MLIEPWHATTVTLANTIQIFKEYIEILNDNTRKYYEMLIILPMDAVVSLELLSIYWGVEKSSALKMIEDLCNNNFLYKKWSPEYDCNMYGIYSLHSDYLKSKYPAKDLEVRSLFDTSWRSDLGCYYAVLDEFLFFTESPESVLHPVHEQVQKLVGH